MPRYIYLCRVTQWHKLTAAQIADKSRSLALLWTLLLHYKLPILVGVIPRLACTGFTFAQPFLVQRVLDFMNEPENVNSTNVAHGLIGAYAIVYVGTAVCRNIADTV